MAMDPVTLALISGVAGAATQEIVSKSWNSGKKWLDDYFKDHQPQAQEKAKENAFDFVLELGNRLQKLENKVNDDSETKKRMQNALSDPDFSAILHNAMISSARTPSKEKHKLLAKIVSNRLQVESKSLKAIVSSMAIDIIPHLSNKHLRLLGTISVITYISPKIVVPYPSKNISSERTFPNPYIKEMNEWWNNWLMKNLSPLGPIGEINNIDYIHLSSVSCINIIGFKPLSEYINKRNFVWNHDEFFNTKIGKEVKNAWEIVGGGRLTSVGILIGLYVYEELSGEKVDINDIWSLNP